MMKGNTEGERRRRDKETLRVFGKAQTNLPFINLLPNIYTSMNIDINTVPLYRLSKKTLHDTGDTYFEILVSRIYHICS